MSDKVRVWHDKTWTCLLVDDGADKATVSLNRIEAAALRQRLVPPDAVQRGDAHGDAGESERLYGLGAGHVLTAADVQDIQNLIADYNDEMGHGANIFHDGRLAILREIGGDELVSAFAAKEQSIVDAAVARALVKYHGMSLAVSPQEGT